MIKSAKFVTKILASNFYRLPFPYKLTFALTYKCNYRCKMCNIWEKEERDELSLSEINKFFKYNNRFSWIDLTGGEIFLREDIFEIVDIILENCKDLKILHFPTNGYFTNKVLSLVEKVLQYRKVIPIVTVSIDGNQKINDKIRGVRNAWESSLDTYRKLKEYKRGYYSLGITLSKHNIDEFNYLEMLNEIKSNCERFKLSDLHFNIAHYSSHYYNNSGKSFHKQEREKLVSVISDLLSLSNFNMSIKDFLRKIYLKGSKNFILEGKSPIRCQALSASCFVDPYGEVYPCTIRDERIMNLRNNNFMLEDYWDGNSIKSSWKKINREECRRCWSSCESFLSILGSILNPVRRI